MTGSKTSMPEYNKNGTFKDKQLEALYKKKPMSSDWHFVKGMSLTSRLSRPEFIQRLHLGVLLGFL